jgi:hypothetical protein
MCVDHCPQAYFLTGFVTVQNAIDAAFIQVREHDTLSLRRCRTSVGNKASRGIVNMSFVAHAERTYITTLCMYVVT